MLKALLCFECEGSLILTQGQCVRALTMETCTACLSYVSLEVSLQNVNPECL